MKRQVNILDCTLRDGSYLIDYQFTVEDTYLISSALCNAGLQHIEVGHGEGLDAQYRGGRKAAESDIEYIKAAVSAVSGKSKIGVFFIPGKGEVESIHKAADAGLNFIRIGTNINEAEQSEKAIKTARRLGLEVWSNLMKSYAVTPEEFSKRCKMVENIGADVVVLVDSAGGMIPNEVREYAAAGKANIKIGLGFHSHNNLQLAIANCLAALEQGVAYLDGSLRGMGRSAGNAPLEILCSLLQREGWGIGAINPSYLMQLAQEMVSPLMPRDTGVTPIAIASGISYFHSSFQPIVNRASKDHKVEPYKTILNIGSEGKVEVNDVLAGKAAKKASESNLGLSGVRFPDFRWLNKTPCVSIESLVSSLIEMSSKTGYKPVISMVRSKRCDSFPLRIIPVRIGNGYCIGHIETASKSEDLNVFRKVDNKITHWMIDYNIKVPRNEIPNIEIIRYDDELLVLNSLLDFVRLNPKVRTIYTPKTDESTVQLGRQILDRSFILVDNEADIGISFSLEQKFSSDDINRIKADGYLVIGQVSSIGKNIIEEAKGRNLTVIRLDMELALINEVSRLFSTKDKLSSSAGRKTVNGINIVAGGIIGRKDDIIVNNISSPTMIIGKADGIGGVLPLDSSDVDRKATVLKWILKTY